MYACRVSETAINENFLNGFCIPHEMKLIPEYVANRKTK